MADYAKDVLVETDWVAEHLDDDGIRIVEVDENPALYAEAHIPGAIGFDWRKDLQDQVERAFLSPEDFGALDLVLKVLAPVEPDRPRDVGLRVESGVLVDLDDPNRVVVEVVGHPIGRDEDVVRVVGHSTPP